MLVDAEILPGVRALGNVVDVEDRFTFNSTETIATVSVAGERYRVNSEDLEVV